jgi:hypothetical protein
MRRVTAEKPLSDDSYKIAMRLALGPRLVIGFGLEVHFNEHDLDSLSALDARYAGTLGSNPWVGKITVAHIGKP